MSDYVHKKAIRLPITESLIQKFGFNDIEDFIEQFDQLVNEKCPELYCCDNRNPYFEIEVTDERPYIDLVLYSSYGEECGEWHNAFYLSDKEKETFVSYFEKLDIKINPDDLRKADYCWYNCCEPPDCYDVGDNDDWTLLFKKAKNL